MNYPETSLVQEAHLLVDRAHRLQDAGRFDDAETLLARAEALIDEADRMLDLEGVPSL